MLSTFCWQSTLHTRDCLHATRAHAEGLNASINMTEPYSMYAGRLTSTNCVIQNVLGCAGVLDAPSQDVLDGPDVFDDPTGLNCSGNNAREPNMCSRAAVQSQPEHVMQC